MIFVYVKPVFHSFINFFIMDLNRATILGRLTRDPEIRNTQTGKMVANISVATGRKWKDQSGAQQEYTEYHNCVLWGKLAEIAGNYLTKGRRVYMEGRLQTRDWTGDDGVKKYKTEIVVDNMIMLDAPRGQASPQPSVATANSEIQTPNSSSEPPMPVIDLDKEEDIKVEDIPF
jgi:single-strand DNA-binding protein